MRALAAAGLLLALGSAGRALGAEPAACLSPLPGDWPQPFPTYVLVILDTSASMDQPAPPATNSCGYPATRSGHARCAARRLFEDHPEARFGLATYAMIQSNCSGACFAGCTYSDFPGGTNGCGSGAGASRHGANIVVPIAPFPGADNRGTLLGWVDNSCAANAEAFFSGFTPLNGSLRDAVRYFSGTYTDGAGTALPSPFSPTDLGCRRAIVILLTDGDETCDTASDATSAAAALFATHAIRTYVVNFIGGSSVVSDQIAAAGGTNLSFRVTDGEALGIALGQIMAPFVIPEICNNVDDNCNGCTDEGFAHYCNQSPVCCAWTTVAERAVCLANFEGSQDPDDLPCATAVQGADPASWLCEPVVEICGNSVDEQCNGAVSEGCPVDAGVPDAPLAVDAAVVDAPPASSDGPPPAGTPDAAARAAERTSYYACAAGGRTGDGGAAALLLLAGVWLTARRRRPAR